jgi:hypothetical protein
VSISAHNILTIPNQLRRSRESKYLTPVSVKQVQSQSFTIYNYDYLLTGRFVVDSLCLVLPKISISLSHTSVVTLCELVNEDSFAGDLQHIEHLYTCYSLVRRNGSYSSVPNFSVSGWNRHRSAFVKNICNEDTRETPPIVYQTWNQTSKHPEFDNRNRIKLNESSTRCV